MMMMLLLLLKQRELQNLSLEIAILDPKNTLIGIQKSATLLLDVSDPRDSIHDRKTTIHVEMLKLVPRERRDMVLLGFYSKGIRVAAVQDQYNQERDKQTLCCRGAGCRADVNRCNGAWEVKKKKRKS